jgi:L-2-hydroxyglutarate oxidase
VSHRYDVAVVGGGIVGLATAYRLLDRLPQLSLILLEKEDSLASHQTGHNSGVIHAGLYYPANSAKARLCREGKAELEAFCEAHEVPFERIGKLVVAVDEKELPALAEIEARARANGVPGLERIEAERIAEIEPHVRGVAALHSPTTGVVDFRAVALAMTREIWARGGEIVLGREVTGMERRTGDGGAEEWILRSAGNARGSRDAAGSADSAGSGEEVRAGAVIACAGLWSDRVAAMTGSAGRQRIVPFRGDYYRLKPEAASMVRGLVYPVSDPRLPFLGIHLTRRIDGEVWAGPNAVLAFARAGYRRRDISISDLAETLTYRGFLRLGLRHWRSGLGEMWRDASKSAFAAAARRFVPELRDQDLEPGPSGVRAQSVRLNGEMVDDFSIGGQGRIVHVRNAPSPAATASLAIGRVIAEMAHHRLELG